MVPFIKHLPELREDMDMFCMYCNKPLWDEEINFAVMQVTVTKLGEGKEDKREVKKIGKCCERCHVAGAPTNIERYVTCSE